MSRRRREKSSQEARILGTGNTVEQNIHLYLPGSDRFRPIDWRRPPGGSRGVGQSFSMQEVAQVKRLIAASVDWAEHAQNQDGGLPTDSNGSESCTWSTAGLLWALYNAGLNTRSRWAKKAYIWLADELNEDGGMPTVRRGDQSTTDATAQFLAAASFVNDHDPRVSRAASWLVDTQHRNGGWSWEKMGAKPHVASTAFAIIGVAMQLEAADGADAVHAGLEWMASVQSPSGGWGLQDGGVLRVSASGLAAFALQLLPGTEDRREAAAEFLVQHTLSEGGWRYEIERAVSHTIVRLAVPYALLGLCASPDERHHRFAFTQLDQLTALHDGSSFVLPGTGTASWPTRDGLLACAAMFRIAS